MGLTTWFNPTQKPRRAGVYQRRHRHHGFYVWAMWDGSKWMRGCPTVNEAATEMQSSTHQLTGFYWRGLLK